MDKMQLGESLFCKVDCLTISNAFVCVDFNIVYVLSEKRLVFLSDFFSYLVSEEKQRLSK